MVPKAMPSKRVTFFGSLAKLTGAGIPIREAGDLLLAHSKDPAVREAVNVLEHGLARGLSIAESLRPALTPLEYGMVTAAENGGRLAEGFQHLESYYELLHQTRASMVRGIIYPLLILHVASATTGVVANLNGGSPLMAMLHAFAWLWVALGSIAIVAILCIKAAAHSSLADGVLRSLPIVRGVWSSLALARWYAVLHFHVLSAQKFSTALEDAAAAAASARLSRASHRMAKIAEQGQTVSGTMKFESVFPGHATLSFATAEATGTLDTETAMQMRASMEQARRAANTAGEWLPRLLYIAALLYGAWHVLQLAGAIGGQYMKALNGEF